MRLSRSLSAERRKVRFIRLNHTNPALWDHSAAVRQIQESKMRVAVRGVREEI